MRAQFRQFFAILAKDARIEFRTRDILFTMAIFSTLLVLVFAFAFLSDPSRTRDYGPGIVWATLLFSATVGQNRLFDRERENSCLWAMLLAPVRPGVVFAAKATGHFVFTAVVETLTVILVVVFFDLEVLDIGAFVAALTLGAAGMSLVGTLFSAMLMNARMKEVLLPLVTFPVLTPVVIAGVKATALAVGAQEEPANWIEFLLGFDLVYGAVTILLFGPMVRGAR